MPTLRGRSHASRWGTSQKGVQPKTNMPRFIRGTSRGSRRGGRGRSYDALIKVVVADNPTPPTEEMRGDGVDSQDAPTKEAVADNPTPKDEELPQGEVPLEPEKEKGTPGQYVYGSEDIRYKEKTYDRTYKKLSTRVQAKRALSRSSCTEEAPQKSAQKTKYVEKVPPKKKSQTKKALEKYCQLPIIGNANIPQNSGQFDLLSQEGQLGFANHLMERFVATLRAQPIMVINQFPATGEEFAEPMQTEDNSAPHQNRQVNQWTQLAPKITQ